MAVAQRCSAADAADAVRAELAAGDADFALRMVIRAVTDLRSSLAEADAEDTTRLLRAPSSTGSRRWDALLAASIGRVCRLAGVERQTWTCPAPLDAWWFVDDTPGSAARTIQRTPPDLACIGIWLDASAFVTA